MVNPINNLTCVGYTLLLVYRFCAMAQAIERPAAATGEMQKHRGELKEKGKQKREEKTARNRYTKDV